MEVAHQGIEIKELTGVGAGQKLPKGSVASVTAAPKILDVGAGPPPTLTRRGVNTLVHIEKEMDETAKTVPVGKTSINDRAPPAPRAALPFPDSFASANDATASTPPKK
jgi:penicillin-binding protein 1A